MTKLKLLTLMAMAGSMAGCASLSPDDMADLAQTKPTTLNVVDITNFDKRTGDQEVVVTQDNVGALGQPPIYSSVQGAYKGRPLTKRIDDYVQNLTQDLISNMDYVTQKTPVGITHFALLDSDLQRTNLLGRQMAESFMHEIHKYRIPVIDFKATQYIRVTEQGDFALTRDYLELENASSIQYVLTGTLVKHQGGYLVNARMLGIDSREVVATAQAMIPFYVVDALIPSGMSDEDRIKDGVKLVQGSR